MAHPVQSSKGLRHSTMIVDASMSAAFMERTTNIDKSAKFTLPPASGRSQHALINFSDDILKSNDGSKTKRYLLLFKPKCIYHGRGDTSKAQCVRY